MMLSLFLQFTDCTAMRLLLNENVVLLLVCNSQCSTAASIERERKKGREMTRAKGRGNLYVSYTKVTYGTERNISVCRCTVKRGMLSCFPFMICQQKAAASTAEVYISRDWCTQKKASKKCRFLYTRFFFCPNRRVEKRDARTSNQFK